ncbi:hypothetical protein MYA_3223 [Burkholderia sp. KJ006]|nr:hypothetical protein MYA_3223 [Burkholderia sp. KJ006]
MPEQAHADEDLRRGRLLLRVLHGRSPGSRRALRARPHRFAVCNGRWDRCIDGAACTPFRHRLGAGYFQIV